MKARGKLRVTIIMFNLTIGIGAAFLIRIIFSLLFAPANDELVVYLLTIILGYQITNRLDHQEK